MSRTGADVTCAVHAAGGYNHVPGIWDPEEQTRAWKKIVDEGEVILLVKTL